VVVEDPGGPSGNGLGHDGGPARPEEEQEELEVEGQTVERPAEAEFTPRL